MIQQAALVILALWFVVVLVHGLYRAATDTRPVE